MSGAIFLDRDGVICVNRPGYVQSWEEFEFLPGVLEAFRHLAKLDRAVVVVTNQSPVGRGLMSLEAMEEINARMVEVVRRAGGRLDQVYSCAHAPDERCACRKPAPGLLVQAAEELDLDLPGSFLVGDAQSDIQAAQAVGVRAILVLTGRGAKQLGRMGGPSAEFVVVTDLPAAVTWIEEQITGVSADQ